MRQNQFETVKDVIALYSFSCSTLVAIDAVSTGEDANVKQHGTVRCRNRSVGTSVSDHILHPGQMIRDKLYTTKSS